MIAPAFNAGAHIGIAAVGCALLALWAWIGRRGSDSE